MKAALQTFRRMRGFTLLYAAGSAYATLMALLLIWVPMRSRPWPAELIMAMPEWVLWMKVHETQILQTAMLNGAVTLAVMAVSAFHTEGRE